MIRSFGDSTTEALFRDEIVRRFRGIARRAKRKLEALNAAGRPYKGTLIVTIESQATIGAICPHIEAAAKLGCNIKWPDKCWVIVAPKEEIEAAGYSVESVVRHEIGHCNGWPADHRDA